MKKSKEQFLLRIIWIIVNISIIFWLSALLYVSYTAYSSANVVNLLYIVYIVLAIALLIISNLIFSLGDKFINSFEDFKSIYRTYDLG